MNYTFASIFPSFTTSIIALLATTVSTATLGGNIVVLIAFFVERSLRIPSNYFIASLAMTDVLIGLFSMNLFITYQLLGYWPLGHLICDLWLSLDFSACLTSQYTVFLITLDRFCLVKIPAKYRNWRTYNKVRIMICISWIFPATLFTLLIFGWSYITGETQRDITKCDVSFTYYPIFNTTLTIGYFWITLIIMCSLYVGIYKVARRLQKKSLESNKRLVQFLTKVDQDSIHSQSNQNSLDDNNNNNNNNGGNNDRKHSKSKVIKGNMKRYRDRTNKHFYYEPKSNYNQSFDDVMDCNLTFNEKCKYDPIQRNLLTAVDDHPHNSLKESHFIEINSKSNYPIKNNTNKCHLEYGSETSGCSTFHPTNNNSTESKTQLSSIIERSQLLPIIDVSKKYEDITFKISKNESSSSISDEYFSLPSVNFYIPSPKVPISSPIQSNQSISSKYIESDNSSPVWIKKDACYDSGLNLYVYDICPQLMKCQTYIHEGNICQNSTYLSDSTSWNQCIQSCCLLEKCEYSDYTTSSDDPSSTLYNQSMINDYWCLRFMDKWNKSKRDRTIKSSCVFNQIKHNSLLWYKSNDKSYLTEYQPNSNVNTDQEICPFCQINKDNNNNKFIQQNKSKQKSGLQLIVEQIKFKVQYCCCYCCILSSKHVNIPLNNNPIQIQSNSTTNNSKTIHSNNNSDNDCVTQYNQLKIKHNKLSIKDKYKQQINSQIQQQQQLQHRKSSITTNKRQTTFSIFQSLSNIDMQNRKHACKALKTISLILGAFMICWTPYHIIVLIKGFCDDINTHKSCVNIHLYNLSYWLCYMNSPINPFCYALSNISFRRTFFRILRCDFQKR
ncbi:unnamed protein product [Schistosoma mattheei]|uniref:G-protein coupled receptors family 1 profile domain-containing protein n=1 Tax=Schistosoma mattheei TaxID=31246 RepID=A0AA85BZ63_9TREM|nr:unnamed protein product [Schistosoma mattheei]